MIKRGDALEQLKKQEANSIDCVVTDPPYGYSFMGKDWDKAVPPVEVWKECLRVLKPGGFAFIMSAPRQDVLSQMIVRITEAGFKTDFTSIYWTYASGFPKASNIGKMVDKRLGKKRKVVGERPFSGSFSPKIPHFANTTNNIGFYKANPLTKGTSKLEGSYAGYQPKPAVEVIIVAMKPLEEKTYVDQAVKNGKGVTWLDDCRVPYLSEGDKFKKSEFTGFAKEKFTSKGELTTRVAEPHQQGRFPANLICSDDVLEENSRYFDLDKWYKNNEN